MSSGPETRFIAAVHRHLPPTIELHREKMANPYRGGTADTWYSGRRADLWIEWKFIALPKRVGTTISLVGSKSPILSPLQQDWLNDRHDEGRDVWVVVGSTEGGLIFVDKAWNGTISAGNFRGSMKTKAGIAECIALHCTGFAP